MRQALETALGTPAEWIGDHEIYVLLVDVAARQEDATALAAYVPQAQALADQYEHRLYQAIAHRATAILHRLNGKPAQAERQLSHALELFSSLDARWQVARTRFEQGRLALSVGRVADAREPLHLALALFEQIHAMPDVVRTRTALAALDKGLV